MLFVQFLSKEEKKKFFEKKETKKAAKTEERVNAKSLMNIQTTDIVLPLKMLNRF